jgi:hypothetical protein
MAMYPVPDQLVEGLSKTHAHIADKWWHRLAEDERAVLLALYDPRQDSCEVKSRRITILVDSSLLSDDEADTDDWADFYEYMLDHPEVFPPFDPCFRTFLIGCLDSRHGGHPVVTAASSGFVCPFNSPFCPFVADQLGSVTPARRS